MASENKKVKNATKIVAYGITFKSNLELTMYNLLRMHKFEFEYEKMSFVIIPEFQYKGKKVQAATYTPDFTLRIGDLMVIIETKGRPNDSWPIREKLFKKFLVDNNLVEETLYVMPRNKTQCSSLIRALLDLKAGKPFKWTNERPSVKQTIKFSLNDRHK